MISFPTCLGTLTLAMIFVGCAKQPDVGEASHPMIGDIYRMKSDTVQVVRVAQTETGERAYETIQPNINKLADSTETWANLTKNQWATWRSENANKRFVVIEDLTGQGKFLSFEDLDSAYYLVKDKGNGIFFTAYLRHNTNQTSSTKSQEPSQERALTDEERANEFLQGTWISSDQNAYEFNGTTLTKKDEFGRVLIRTKYKVIFADNTEIRFLFQDGTKGSTLRMGDELLWGNETLKRR